MNNMTPVVKQLLIINIIFFIGSQLVGPEAYKLFSLYYIENPNFKIWQFVTNMFMHAPMPNFMHILFNMIALYSFGSLLENYWGGKKFLFFYLSCGLGATLLYTGVNYYSFHSTLDTLIAQGFSKDEVIAVLNGKNNQDLIGILNSPEYLEFVQTFFGTAVGASGAIYGLLVAFAFMFPEAQLGLMFIPVPIKAKYFVPGLLTIDLILGFKGSSIFGSGGTGIAHFAHIGGAIVGFIMMWYWKKNSFNNKRWN